MTSIHAFLGGSFDPVHLAHLTMAHTVWRTLTHALPNTDVKVSLLPTAGNPFKGTPTATHHRLAMLQLGVADLPIGVDTHELSLPPPVYTIDTVRHLAAQNPHARLIFIVGQDSLAALPTWKNGLQILDFVQIWAFSRSLNTVSTKTTLPNVPTEVQAHITHDLHAFLQGTHKIYQDPTAIAAISSSQVRALLAQNPAKAAKLLPKAVADYISTHQLYQNA
ncbi:nicotinate (nicotinamide) nucleotide adenylyltransferase [Moraxella caviae]|uniref:Probable nicotinate-nucleotide adenylyltransferase n=1 Tax=Moraxella caviae TaxID=34060 RepID=A0A1T0A1M8_9GAMM|nr:nicotinate (nicotinamide) nucleotide adenylyltransferase [Moraxella caviae]OOR89640.1 nicotinate (nicotinamide) nucleotide adenylyltransferase [Moraxella caviae]STZ10328.1 Nicotinate-nucleotide adenylyltransferase [Moraxella caviae]VEW10442.1 Nicotinate-nucleotide adenylyltransferase [Moraxella caviae]